MPIRKLLLLTFLTPFILLIFLRAALHGLIDWVRYRNKPPPTWKYDCNAQMKARGEYRRRQVSSLGATALWSSNQGGTGDESVIRYANIHAMSQEQLIKLVYELKDRVVHLECATRELGELRRENRRLSQSYLTFVRRLNRRDS